RGTCFTIRHEHKKRGKHDENRQRHENKKREKEATGKAVRREHNEGHEHQSRSDRSESRRMSRSSRSRSPVSVSQATKHMPGNKGTEQNSANIRRERFELERPIKQEPDDDEPGQSIEGRTSNGVRRSEKGTKQASSDPEDKAKPDFGLSGKLAEDTNTFRGVVIKYNEPPEARKPKIHWRLYPFKGEQALPLLHVHRQSAYLLGRDRLIADIPIDHPSCSKQHAVLQFRLVSYQRDDMSTGRRVRPYIIDLESANGTYINNKRIEAKVYVELLEKDMLKFGYSSREYIMLQENSKDDLVEDGGVD
ncbi:PREDICTED: smad nuclear-interacting protein 1-like, partial [Priapulus caudatus]|uniref:Smad nuclear-interacting protein 1-like n=1 Tax=Priapulus caudatus TaxID=37621 RepID=A0ABM1E6Z1_PRICU